MDRRLKMRDKVPNVLDRRSKETNKPWEISCPKLYFSVNSENFVEVYVNVNGILLPIRKGEMVLKTIQEVAKEFNVSTRTIRYYEELGLLCPHRSSTNQRIFSKKELAKLKLIFRGKRYGFSLEEIKEMVLLFDFDRSGIQQLERTVEYGEQKIQEIDSKIAELTQMKRELQQMHGMFSEKLATLKGEMQDE
ncbi:MerR family DNA-binding transcriptional regulator [Lysinibacillus sp. OL1]|nr:MerR family DNA-binding transcriptional regulator [Lysinibacillus sp. OL1]